MKNLVLAVGVSVLALAGCDNNANAQAQQVSADVGSPQGDPGVDVAPLPEGNQPAASPNAGDAVLIQETISSTTTQPMQ